MLKFFYSYWYPHEDNRMLNMSPTTIEQRSKDLEKLASNNQIEKVDDEISEVEEPVEELVVELIEELIEDYVKDSVKDSVEDSVKDENIISILSKELVNELLNDVITNVVETRLKEEEEVFLTASEESQTDFPIVEVSTKSVGTQTIVEMVDNMVNKSVQTENIHKLHKLHKKPKPQKVRKPAPSLFSDKVKHNMFLTFTLGFIAFNIVSFIALLF